MKKFSQLNTSNIQQPETTAEVLAQHAQSYHNQIIDQVEQINVETQVQLTQEHTEFPEYMLNDPSFIGFADSDTQSILYNSAAFSLFTPDVNSILDVGCGRGDFGKFIQSNIKTDVNYKGIDLNPIVIQAGRHKYKDEIESGQFVLENQVFNINYSDNTKYDWVFHNFSLIMAYGVPGSDITTIMENRYTYLEQMITKSLEISNKGVVFMLLNDNTPTETLFHFSHSGIAKILYDLNFRFAIDNSEFPTIFKLVVFNNNF
jgi:SAM-dependent methyltransferase